MDSYRALVSYTLSQLDSRVKLACFRHAALSIAALNTASDLESDRAFVPARIHAARINPFLLPPCTLPLVSEL